jgi:hydrogenase maturation protease
VNQVRKICIIGIGNTLRSDDGIGAHICSELDKERLPGVFTLIVQQINTEMIEPLLAYEYLLFVDAAVDRDEVSVRPLATESGATIASSHSMSVTMFRDLAKNLYSKQPEIFLCAVPGEDFDLGEKLSVSGKSNAEKAIQKIKAWITGL